MSSLTFGAKISQSGRHADRCSNSLTAVPIHSSCMVGAGQTSGQSPQIGITCTVGKKFLLFHSVKTKETKSGDGL